MNSGNRGPRVIINPGTGPVGEHSYDNARINVAAFVTDLQSAGRKAKVLNIEDSTDGEGRYFAKIEADGEIHEIEMPGVPLENVRFVDPETQSIFDFPRLYVDGSSWVWKYALGVCGPDDE